MKPWRNKGGNILRLFWLETRSASNLRREKGLQICFVCFDLKSRPLSFEGIYSLWRLAWMWLHNILNILATDWTLYSNFPPVKTTFKCSIPDVVSGQCNRGGVRIVINVQSNSKHPPPGMDVTRQDVKEKDTAVSQDVPSAETSYLTICAWWDIGRGACCCHFFHGHFN